MAYCTFTLTPSCCQRLNLGDNMIWWCCAQTGFEGLWSPTEAGSAHAIVAEHVEAHDRLGARLIAALYRRNAIQIYRSTEPGDPRRRGIGPYL